MSPKQKKYDEIKDCMKPGDVIAFSKESPISEFIELVTDSEVSHVGVVLPAKLFIDGESRHKSFNLVAEATASGVRITRLCGLQKHYKGEIWWLPLSCKSRKKLQPNLDNFCQFLLSGDGTLYDFEGAIKEGIRNLIDREQGWLKKAVNWCFSLFRDERNKKLVDELVDAPELENITDKSDIRTYLIKWLIDTPLFGKITSEEDIKKYFCSELVTEAFKLHGVINVCDSETVNPLELCQFKIYKDYVQFKGDKKKIIKGFNSKSP